jgi:hypothetical protein
MPSFNRVIRYRRCDATVFLYAFDLIELNGDDPRRDPLEGRKATLEMILAKSGPGIHATSTWKAMARPSSPMPARWDSKVLCRSVRTLPLRPLARLAQDEERECAGSEA